jgi:type IV pilus assembly protein PilB
VNVRVETVPTTYGHDAVLRLFTFKEQMLNLDMLGLSPFERRIVDDIISHPSGMVLFVGPTGSGKTTTLYSIVNQLNNPERKIITLEDPVEYNIEGITQVPVDSAENRQGFADKLRAVLRLDPDVIMVGEIRDIDTAKTALQAALTGHLVLSTYHASSASAAISRMIDAIGENPLFAASIRLITAQRLIRRLDDSTKQPYQPDAQTIEYIRKVLMTLPPRVQKPDLSAITLYKPGASAENPFGFKGQLAVRELLQMTPPVRELLSRPSREITTELIEQTAVRGGMITMMQDGILKALQGLTTIEEVFRAVG